MVRKKPIRHTVRAHKREGKPVKSFERGFGVRTSKQKRIVRSAKAQDRLRVLARDLDTRLWGIDTEYCHGVKGLISFSPGISRGRIGPDLDFEGTLDELLEQTKPGGKIYKYLKANDYQTKVTMIESTNLDPKEDRYLDLFGKVRKIEV